MTSVESKGGCGGASDGSGGYVCGACEAAEDASSAASGGEVRGTDPMVIDKVVESGQSEYY